MANTKGTSRIPQSPASQLAGFIAKFDPAIGKLARASRAALRESFPTSIELVYDNYNALAIGFASTERPSDVIISLAVFPRGVSLYFMHGAKLPDPQGLLKGSGNQGRFVPLKSVSTLSERPVQALLRAAVQQAKSPLATIGKGYTVIRSISKNQRPRRPPAGATVKAARKPTKSASVGRAASRQRRQG